MVELSVNGAEIRFIKSDSIWEEAYFYANRLVSHMYNNKTLLGILLETTTSFRLHFGDNQMDDFISFINDRIVVYDKHKVELEQFKDMYCELLKQNLGLRLIQEYQFREKYVDKVRGYILEIILRKKAAKLNKRYAEGCRIYVNETYIKKGDSETVDFAGYNIDKCNFYECKVSPISFSKDKGLEQVNLLFEIQDKLAIHSLCSSIYCVTAGHSDSIKTKLSGVLPVHELSRLKFLGKRDLVV